MSQIFANLLRYAGSLLVISCIGANAADCIIPPRSVEPQESLIVGAVGPAEFLDRSSNGSIEITEYISEVRTKKVLQASTQPVPVQFRLAQKEVLWLVTNDYWSMPKIQNIDAVMIVRLRKTGEYELVDGRACEP